MRLAVIPARGGSKRIPRKNIRDFCGRPMIAWPIAAAQESGCFDHIFVSTDDDEIARIAKAHGAEVPFRRPAELADDFTPTRPVVAHAIEAATAQFGAFDAVCCIYATAPFLQPDDLRQGLKILKDRRCDYVFAVTTYAFPIQRALRRQDDGTIEMFHPEHFNSRSQDLETAWHDAGQFYWATAQTWFAETVAFGPSSFGVELPRYRVQDIDTFEDWERAQLMFRGLRQHN